MTGIPQNQQHFGHWKTVLVNALKLLHPYTPFITEEIFCTLQSEEESIMICRMAGVHQEEWHFAEDEAAAEMIKERQSAASKTCVQA